MEVVHKYSSPLIHYAFRYQIRFNSLEYTYNQNSSLISFKTLECFRPREKPGAQQGQKPTKQGHDRDDWMSPEGAAAAKKLDQDRGTTEQVNQSMSIGSADRCWGMFELNCCVT